MAEAHVRYVKRRPSLVFISDPGANSHPPQPSLRIFFVLFSRVLAGVWALRARLLWAGAAGEGTANRAIDFWLHELSSVPRR